MLFDNMGHLSWCEAIPIHHILLRQYHLAQQKYSSRATLLLMQTKHLSEARAYRQLQQYAMTKQRRLAEVADIVIATLQK